MHEDDRGMSQIVRRLQKQTSQPDVAVLELYLLDTIAVRHASACPFPIEEFRSRHAQVRDPPFPVANEVHFGVQRSRDMVHVRDAVGVPGDGEKGSGEPPQVREAEPTLGIVAHEKRLAGLPLVPAETAVTGAGGRKRTHELEAEGSGTGGASQHAVFQGSVEFEGLYRIGDAETK